MCSVQLKDGGSLAVVCLLPIQSDLGHFEVTIHRTQVLLRPSDSLAGNAFV